MRFQLTGFKENLTLKFVDGSNSIISNSGIIVNWIGMVREQ